MVKLQEVSKSYGEVYAVRSASLDVPKGSIYGIIGRSGAGKSSLLRVMSLLEKPDSGGVYYDGARVDSLSGAELLSRRRKMGMIFQNFNLLASRNAAANIAFPLEIAGMHKKDAARRVDELLETVGLSDKKKARLKELSGGQKQRVAIARALAANPEVLFCDEATSALDPQTTRSILSLLRELHSRLGLTVILVTHEMSVIREICDEVAVMEAGSIVEESAAASLFSSPQSTAAKELIYA